MAGSPEAPRKAHPKHAPGHDIEVRERNTDTGWAMFQALQNGQDPGYWKTEPAALQPRGDASPPSGAVTVEDVLLEARRNNRLCPTPVVWQRLYDFLPNKTDRLPPVPRTRAEWEQMPGLQKRTRLREHIEWAAMQGVLQKVHDALKALPEARWHHIGE